MTGEGHPSRSQKPLKPELLAPAGDAECLRAAIENGADAVYFGLQKHNARIRASNFDGQDLPEIMATLHRRGVRGYVTLNTLAFPKELESLEATIRELTEAGVDAVIVQDLGLTRLIRAITPDLEIHASTQMSVTSEEGVRLARELGCSRVILARELSLAEIGKVKQEAELPVEVFVHGALCVAYSGQCLTSEALGGRSANRGECAQACRMPYEIVCDGEKVDLDDVQYLLSPKDLAAYDLVPRLIELGVASLKIEGRLKAPEYVANITRHYREAIDLAWEGRAADFSATAVQEMELSFSRGFSHGFLDGNDHKVLVRGDYAKKRGLYLGRIAGVTGSGIRLEFDADVPVKPGDGLVFDGDEAAGAPEQGGRVFEVIAEDFRKGPKRPGKPRVELRFGRQAIDLNRVKSGQKVWKTDDPELTKRLRKSFEGPPSRKVDVDFEVVAKLGEPLRIVAKAANGTRAEVTGSGPLEAAATNPAVEALFRTQLGRLGGTVYQIRDLNAAIDGHPMVPMSVLNGLRRDLVERLDRAAGEVVGRTLNDGPALPGLLAPIRAERERQIARRTAAETGTGSRYSAVPVPLSAIDELDVSPEKTATGTRSTASQSRFLGHDAPSLSVLCRRTDQVEAAVAAGIRTILADYQDIKEYGKAVAAARAVEGVSIYLATPRIEKPAEANLFRYLAKQGADGLLVRNAGGMSFCAENGVPFLADFSLNAANPLTVGLLKERGAIRVTASYDLNVDQLVDLLDEVPPDWIEVVIHQQIPMFHMEHCVFCAFLSPGTDHTNCGRPCDVHDVKLRDRVGMEHPLKADVGCRNTLFNAVPQTAAESLTRLRNHGARHLRIEFLDDSPEAVARTIGLYRDALSGRRDPRTLWRDLKASSQYGVTRGALAILG